MINGFLLINKDSGITSSRVAQIIKKKFNFKKVGHLGTLDPMAEGLLILAINRATKFSSLLLQSNKTYQAEVTLGQQTDTDDAEGAITSTRKVTCHEQEVKDKLLSLGMPFVRLSGSGPSFYTITENLDQAKNIANKMKRKNLRIITTELL